MSLRHGILGLLCGRELSGYDLSREFELTLANVWSASHSQIYPELHRLERDGLIAQVGSGPRGRKVYRATEAGRQEVLTWLRSESPGRELRVEALLQGFFWWLLDDEETAGLLERERQVHLAELARYEAVAGLLEEVGWREEPERRSQRVMLELGIRYERALVEWAEWARTELGAASR